MRGVRKALVGLWCCAALADPSPWISLNDAPASYEHLAAARADAANASAARAVARFHVLGERNSGTNYLRYVVEANVRGVVHCRAGWKHALLDAAELAAWERYGVLDGAGDGPDGAEPPRALAARGAAPPQAAPPPPPPPARAAPTVVVAIVRDAFDWAVSMYHKPYEATRATRVLPGAGTRAGLAAFLRAPWESRIA